MWEKYKYHQIWSRYSARALRSILLRISLTNTLWNFYTSTQEKVEHRTFKLWNILLYLLVLCCKKIRYINCTRKFVRMNSRISFNQYSKYVYNSWNVFETTTIKIHYIPVPVQVLLWCEVTLIPPVHGFKKIKSATKLTHSNLKWSEDQVEVQ